MLTAVQAEVLEALVDPRLDGVAEAAVPAEVVAQLRDEGLLRPERRDEVAELLERRVLEQPIVWGTWSLTQGEVLAAFATHCREELDDVEVAEETPTLLAVRWRSELSRFELRNGFLGLERLVTDDPTMLLGDIEPRRDALVSAFLDDATLRARLAICDLDRLERLGTVRSSAFVYLEWFLRDAYGVKLLPSSAFTQGLIERGVISLGMG
ncbi:MAG: hypothetical protein OEW31_05275 [Thermoleophilia bacterium]|nr:hypothetical protein [Thermoleophilia bacterium]MDH5333321.1 hypothetical protein [Thermoleophilia bacterium]